MSKFRHYNTVGDLITILSSLPRDTKILTKNPNMLEQTGYQLGGNVNIEIQNFNKERIDIYDAFDSTSYSYDCITLCLKKDEEVHLTGIIL